MRIYKTCFQEIWCAYKNLEDAKEMFIADLDCSEMLTDDDLNKHRDMIQKLTGKDLEKEPYTVGEYSLEIGEMSEEEFNNLPEFDGY